MSPRHPRVGEARETGARRGSEQELDAVAIRDVRAVDLGHEHQALGAHERMTLASFDLLASYSGEGTLERRAQRGGSESGPPLLCGKEER
jgi:hypothetical protein